MQQHIAKFIFIFLAHLAFSQTPPARIEWQTGMYGSYAGTAGIIAADLDGDQRNELILSGRADRQGFTPTDYFYVLHYDLGQDRYVMKWISRVFFAQINVIAVHDFDQKGGPEVFIGFKNGTVRVFDGTSFQEIHSFNIPSAKTGGVFPELITKLYWLGFGDANNDGATDLVASDGEQTFIYNSRYQISRLFTHGAAHFEVGNVDSDPREEIVFADGTIMEISSGAIKFEPSVPVSSPVATDRVALRDMNLDNVADVVYSNRDLLCAFDVRNQRKIWEVQWQSAAGFNQPITALTLFDYNNDGVDDVFLGNLSYDTPYCYDGKTGKAEFNLPSDFMHDGVSSIAVSNLDYDESPEMVYVSDAISSRSDNIHVINLSDLRQQWQSVHLDGSYTFDCGDVDNDGSKEIVVASWQGDSEYGPGYVQVYDAETYALEWQSRGGLSGTLLDAVTMVKIRDLDGDHKNELLVAADPSMGNAILYRLDSGYQATEYLRVSGMDQILDAEMADVDADGGQELIITTGTYAAGSTHPEEYVNKIHVYDPVTRQLKWQSEQIGGIGTRVFSLKIGNVDQDEAKEMVAILKANPWGGGTVWGDVNKLVILDGNTRTVWTDAQYNCTAVDLVDWNGDRQQEIVAATDSGKIIFLNGASLRVDSVQTTPSQRINAMQALDIDSDGTHELVYTDRYTLNLYQVRHKRVYWQSDTINKWAGSENRLAAGNFDQDPQPEILLDGNHAFIKFELDAGTAAQKTNQEISFSTLDVQTAPASFNLSATATSGLPVSYRLSSVPAGVASLAENVVTLSEAGLVTITAFQAGNEKYNPAPEVVRTVQVEKPLGIAEKPAAGVRVYPVPAAESLLIALPPGLSDGKYDLFNYRGQLAMQGEVNGQHLVKLDITPLEGGLYILRIRNATHNVTKKVMLKRN